MKTDRITTAMLSAARQERETVERLLVLPFMRHPQRTAYFGTCRHPNSDGTPGQRYAIAIFPRYAQYGEHAHVEPVCLNCGLHYGDELGADRGCPCCGAFIEVDTFPGAC